MLSESLKKGIQSYAIGDKLRALRLKKKMGLVELGGTRDFPRRCFRRSNAGSCFRRCRRYCVSPWCTAWGWSIFLRTIRSGTCCDRDAQRAEALYGTAGRARHFFLLRVAGFCGRGSQAGRVLRGIPATSSGEGAAASSWRSGVSVGVAWAAGAASGKRRTCARRGGFDLFRFITAALVPAHQQEAMLGDRRDDSRVSGPGAIGRVEAWKSKCPGKAGSLR